MMRHLTEEELSVLEKIKQIEYKELKGGTLTKEEEEKRQFLVRRLREIDEEETKDWPFKD